MSNQVTCQNCGAPMVPKADGRVYACDFCSAQRQVAIDASQIAAGMRLDLANTEAFLAGLARSLQSALTELTRVQHHEGRIVLVEVNLGDHVFIAKRERLGVIGQQKKLVRGVALKTKTHPLDVWVGLLSDAIAAHANENARAAQVLAQLKGE